MKTPCLWKTVGITVALLLGAALASSAQTLRHSSSPPTDDSTAQPRGTRGGSSSYISSIGTIFRLSMGLEPFVLARPASGKVGEYIPILGNGFKTATAVEFNGTAAAFAAHSNTEIVAVVPAGATTGYITVVTPNDALESNTVFRVKP
jgi:IPT/TIG domain